MKVTVDEKKGTVTIELSLLNPPKPGPKMNAIANTGGFQNVAVEYDGKPLAVNAYVGYKR